MPLKTPGAITRRAAGMFVNNPRRLGSPLAIAEKAIKASRPAPSKPPKVKK